MCRSVSTASSETNNPNANDNLVGIHAFSDAELDSFMASIPVDEFATV